MSEQTRENIMNAAQELFAESGYAAVTTKEIAKNAGISEVTLYRYFDSKRSLFNAIVTEHMHNHNLASYVENEATYDARHDLMELADRLVESYRKNGALLKMVIKDNFLNSEAKTHSKHVENADMKAMRIYFEALKEKGIIKDDATHLRKFFFRSIHSFAMRNYILTQETVSEEEQSYLEWLKTKIIDTILM